MEAIQKARYHGDIRIKLKEGELIHIECSQSCLPRDILEDRFVCVLLRRVSDAVYSEDEDEGSRKTYPETGPD
jgi:hypothetical protein